MPGPRCPPHRLAQAAVTATLAAAGLWLLPWLHAQAPAAPGGFVESSTATATRPLLTAAEWQAILPARGTFTFPAPYQTTGIRLTNAADCAGTDCVNHGGYSYWRNLNNSSGSNFLYAMIGLQRTKGGTGPTLFRYDKTTGETVNLGPIFLGEDSRSYSSGEGFYFSATQPAALYVQSARQLTRVDVLTHATTVVFDISDRFGTDKEIWQTHSSHDDRVHSFTLRLATNYAVLGCAAYDEATALFSFFPIIGGFDECQVDKSGRWLLIKENVDDINGEDNRIIDLATGAETVLFDADGAGGHSDNGFGVMLAADNWHGLPNAIRRWTFSAPPLAAAPVIYRDPDWTPASMHHLSFANARSAPLGQQYACGSAASRTNGPRANEIACVRLDGSLATLVVAPVMTDFDTAGGGSSDYAKSPKGNLDPTGEFFFWTSNVMGPRLDAFIARVPGHLLVTPPADITAPTVSITAPSASATVSGTVVLSAAAADATGVTGVQFMLDGALLGSELTVPAYSWNWNTATAADGVHALRAVARDAAGNTTTSAPVIVTVLNAPTGPAISQVRAEAVTGTAAVLAWTTSQLADGQVEYGPTSAYGSTSSLTPALSAAHWQPIGGLAPSTTYHYRVTSRNAQGVSSTSGDFAFTTSGPALITAVSATQITNTSAVISWTTSLPASSEVEYGPTTAYGSASPVNPATSTLHQQMLLGLTPNTTYHYRVQSVTTPGVTTTSGDFTFTTLATVGNAAPGGLLESASSAAVRPIVPAATLQALLPERGAFNFPAPYLTQGVRLTNHNDCAVFYDCVSPITGGSWRNLSNSAGSNHLYAAISLDKTNGGVGPALFRYDKTTGETLNLGPIFDADDDRSWGSLDGWYFSPSMPTTLYVGLDTQLQRYDVLTRATTVVFDITSQFGDDKEVYHALSSHDDRVHSFTLRLVNNYLPVGCGVFREDTQQFAYYPVTGLLYECQIDKSGHWLLMREDRTDAGVVDNRIVNLTTGEETVVLSAQGAASRADTGFRAMVGVDSADALPNAIRRWDFGPFAAGPILYHGLAGQSPSFTEVSFANARSAAFDQQYACGAAVNRTNGPRANEVICVRLDGSLSTLVVAPVMTDLDALGGGPDDDLIKQPYGTLDPTGEFFLWISNVGGDRMDAFLVRVPSHLLVTVPADRTPPAGAITGPVNGTTVSGDLVITATATDAGGVAGVRFQIDGENSGIELTSPPFSWTWPTTTVDDGVHVLTVIARDLAGNIATSVPVEITVQNTPGSPVISDVSASGVIERLALIRWRTDQLADGQVEYGVTTGYGQSTAVNATKSATHLQTLAGLAPGTTYHYRVRSKNAQNESTTSGDFTFTTRSAPVITGIVVSAITGTSATVSWTTDLPSNTQIEYGLTPAYGDATNADEQLVTSHVQGLYALEPGALYHFRVYSVTDDGVMSVSADFTFSTAGDTAIGGVSASSVTGTSAVITWSTNQPADSRVEYGPTAAYGSQTPTAPALVTVHSRALGGLAPGTLYHYRAISTSATGQTAVSADATFTTASAPAIAGVGASAITGTAFTVSWTTDQNADSRVEYGPTTSYGSTTAVDPSLVTLHGMTLSGLTPGTTYHYRVRSTNGAGLSTTSAPHTATTASPPALAGVAAGAITGTTATVVWTTDQLADSRVEYGLTTTYGSATPVNTALVTSHGQPLTGLVPATTYHYRVTSVNTLGLSSTSAGATFTTAAPPAISGITVSNVTATSATVTWTTDQAADTRVEYGPTTAYGNLTATDPALTTSHAQTIVGLEPGGTYHYRVRSTNTMGVTAVSANGVFTTLSPPVISAVAVTAVAATSATIQWTTSLASDTQIDYGLTTAYGSTTALNGALVTAHSQALTGLTQSTLYHFRVKSRGASGALAISGNFTFTTAGPAAAAAVVWTNLVNTTVAGAVLRKSAGCAGCPDAGAISQQVIVGGEGYVEFTASETTTSRIIGFDHTSTGTSTNEILWGLYLSGAFAEVRESGTYRTDLQYATGDLFRIAVVGTQVRYSRNGTVFYTSTVAVSYPLIVDTSFLDVNATINNAVIFGAAPTPVPPVISGVAATGITGTAATVTWTTDVASSSQVEYGLSTAYGSATTVDPALLNGHSQTIGGLAPGTTYHYRVKSTANALTAVSGNGTFTTVGPPVITGVSASGVGGSTATVTWTTDQLASSQVEYGLSTAFGSMTPLNGAPMTSHSELLSGLSAATTYHYRVRSVNAQGVPAVSGTFTFTTAAPPVLAGIAATGVTGTTATIVWTSDQAADTQVEYGPTTAYGSTTTLNPALTTAHAQGLAGLAPGSVHHYRVRSRNAQGLLAVSGDFTFSTAVPPVLSAIAVSAITATSATITWVTDQASDSVVEYGLTPSYGSTTPLDPAPVTSHSRGLTGLAGGTTYHFRVRSTNGAGLSATSADGTFTTASPPVISGLAATAVTGTSATLVWTTDQAADSLVEYGPTTAYGTTAPLDPALVASHSQTIGGLVPGTLYHARVRSTNSAGLFAISGDLAFTTVAPPVISAITASAITPASATIGWTTNQPATTQVDYGLTTAYGSSTAVDPALVSSHNQTLTGLASGTTYHYRARSVNGVGLPTVSAGGTFTTVGPPIITGVSASSITTTTAILGWTTDQVSSTQVEYGLTTAYGSTTPLAPALVTSHAQTVTDLAPGTLYHYRVMSTNGFGLPTTSADFTFTTLAPPVISGVAALGITGSAATITWTTNHAASTQVDYGLTTAYGSTTALDATLVTSHSQAVGGLANGTVYHYRVRSTNGAGLTTTSADFTFTTVAAPVISGVSASAITGTTAVIGWTTNQAADTQVEYGLTTAYGSTTTLNAAMVTSHSQPLSGLAPGTLYHYRVRSANSVGVVATSADFVFTTVAPAAISSVAASAVTGTTATIAWTTDQASDTQVEYGPTTAYGSTTALNPALVTSHSQGLTGLSMGTLYHYRVRSANGVGVVGTSANFTFTTVAPPAVSGVAASALTGTTATITWTTDQASSTQVDYGPTTAYGSTTVLNPALVTSHSQGLTGLAIGTLYHYRVRSTNSVGLQTASGDFTFTTVAPPVISAVAATGMTNTTATITWTTDQPADTQVEYGFTTAYGSTTALNPALVTSHSQGLTGLVSGSLYHYRVKSTNGAGLQTVSAGATFSTTGPAPVIWTSLVNATSVNNVLTKSAGCDGCEDSGAVSQQRITAGDGFIEFTAGAVTSSRRIGLSNTSTGTTSSEIRWALSFQSGNVEVRESGTYRTDTNCVATDVFRIAIVGGQVRYSKNGVVFYTSTVAATYPLLVDTSLLSPGATFVNVVISGQ